MFARSDEIGVRSSWLASAISWRCAESALCSASSVLLKLDASRASSSPPPTCRRSDRSSSPASDSVRRVKRAIGASAVRATSAPSIAAKAMPARPTTSRINRMRLSSWSVSASGRAIITAPRAAPAAPAVPSVSTRRCVPFTVRSPSERPLPLAAIARSRAFGGICGVVPWPRGAATAPAAETNCT